MEFFPNLRILDPSAPWERLKHEARNLGIAQLSVYEIYCKYIFPSFHKFDKDEMAEHLKFLAENVYIAKFENRKGKDTLTSKLKSLKCIHCSTGIHEINYFHDANLELFKMVVDDDMILPKYLQEEHYRDFLISYGLKTVPTQDDFVQYCEGIEKKPLSN